MSANLFAVVEKNTNRAVMLIESGVKSWVQQNLITFDILEVRSVGSATFTTPAGNISTVSISPVESKMSKDDYHIITRFPDTISLGEAYSLIA